MKRIFLAIALCLVAQYARAEVGIGLGWPYAGMKYNISDLTAIEARYATGSGVNVIAGRFYWNFSSYGKLKSHEELDSFFMYGSRHVKLDTCYGNRLNLFTGLEGGHVKFATQNITGNGYEVAVFLGGEYFFSKRTSFMLDFSPTMIGLKSDDYKVSGIEWVVNGGLYFYL